MIVLPRWFACPAFASCTPCLDGCCCRCQHDACSLTTFVCRPRSSAWQDLCGLLYTLHVGTLHFLSSDHSFYYSIMSCNVRGRPLLWRTEQAGALSTMHWPWAMHLPASVVGLGLKMAAFGLGVATFPLRAMQAAGQAMGCGKQRPAPDVLPWPAAVLTPAASAKNTAPGITSLQLPYEDSEHHGMPGPTRAVLAECSAVGCPVSTAQRIVFVIPGNPGSTRWYLGFMDHVLATVQAELGAEEAASTAVVALGHIDHSAACFADGRAAGLFAGTWYGMLPGSACLSSQLRHKRLALHALLAHAPPSARVVVMGHSIGAWMAMQLTADAELTRRIDSAALLFPTVAHIGSAPNGRAMWPLFEYAQPLAVAATAALAAAPNAVAGALLGGQVQPDAHQHLHDALAALVHPGVAHAALHMSWHEMVDLREVPWYVRAVGEKLHAYFGVGDGWNRWGEAAWFMEAVPGAHVRIDDRGYKHAFVMDEDAAADVAQTVTSWVLASSHRRVQQQRQQQRAHTPPSERVPTTVSQLLERARSVSKADPCRGANPVSVAASVDADTEPVRSASVQANDVALGVQGGANEPSLPSAVVASPAALAAASSVGGGAQAQDVEVEGLLDAEVAPAQPARSKRRKNRRGRK